MNFLDDLKRHEEIMRPCAMACLLAEAVKETVEIDHEYLGVFNGELLCHFPEDETDSICLFPIEVTEKEIRGNYEKFYSESDPSLDSRTPFLLEKIGMSFQETERSREMKYGTYRGKIRGRFILKVE